MLNFSMIYLCIYHCKPFLFFSNRLKLLWIHNLMFYGKIILSTNITHNHYLIGFFFSDRHISSVYAIKWTLLDFTCRPHAQSDQRLELIAVKRLESDFQLWKICYCPIDWLWAQKVFFNIPISLYIDYVYWLEITLTGGTVLLSMFTLRSHFEV